MRRLGHAARIAGGYILLFLGIIGLFLPLLQGVLLIVAGATMLGWDLEKMREARSRIAARVRRFAGRRRPPSADGDLSGPGGA
ncbi:MAG: hypothetical protein IT574_06480 [Candidatus Aureabacteria bacterium]|jgi:hypothetical protein|nr:hypothetical protein [Candidatus Auribacterota bacterium]NLW94829.1 hypothetical protein [Chlamydiota bacterium]HOE28138.1 hypothetical protein [bacterium]HQM52369.1 hypothetical protein [bacterium]